MPIQATPSSVHRLPIHPSNPALESNENIGDINHNPNLLMGAIKTSVTNALTFNAALRWPVMAIKDQTGVTKGFAQGLIFSMNPIVGTLVNEMMGGDHLPTTVTESKDKIRQHLLLEQYAPLIPGLAGFIFDCALEFAKANGTNNFLTSANQRAFFMKEIIRALICNLMTAGAVGAIREYGRTHGGAHVKKVQLNELLTADGLQKIGASALKAPYVKNFLFSAAGGLLYGTLSALTFEYLASKQNELNTPLENMRTALFSTAALFGTLVVSWGVQHAFRLRLGISKYEHL